MAPGEVSQILSAIEGLHDDVLANRTEVGELKGQIGQLKGQLGNGINREIKDIRRWIETRPAECPYVRNNNFIWKLIAAIGGLSGWAAFGVAMAKMVAEKVG